MILLVKRCFKIYPKSLGPAPGFITIQIRYLTINLDFSLEYVFSYIKKFLLAWFTILTTFQRTSQYTHVDNSRSMRNTIFLFWLLLIKIQTLHFLVVKNIRRWWCKMSVVKKNVLSFIVYSWEKFNNNNNNNLLVFPYKWCYLNT